MGALSEICSALGGFSGVPEKEKSPEQLRKEHGFDQFDDYMQGLQNYDPAAELKDAEHQAASPADNPRIKQANKKGK